MIKKTIEYIDYDGNKRKEEFHFNLTESELMEMEMTTSGGFNKLLKRIVNSQEIPEIFKVFKEIIWKSYGIKADDGRRFIKSEKISEDFSQTEAYNILFMELSTDDKKAAKFINGVIPKNLSEENKKILASRSESEIEDNKVVAFPGIQDLDDVDEPTETEKYVGDIDHIQKIEE